LHEVTISKSYYLGAFEVTQEQYEKVMETNPSRFNGEKNPVEKVSWNDAVSFCKRLSAMQEEKTAGREYRLPTEAEWEYACRAASTTSFCFGDNSESLAEYAWFGAGPLGKTHPVGEKRPNRWGLYDMHGNVHEFCQDYWYANYSSEAAIDPKGPSDGASRVIRGGCWYQEANQCRSAFRTKKPPLDSDYYVGFRVAMSLPAKKPERKPTN
jgi:formylglycine-generating enzyme required for sulfatase activity